LDVLATEGAVVPAGPLAKRLKIFSVAIVSGRVTPGRGPGIHLLPNKGEFDRWKIHWPVPEQKTPPLPGSAT
jgi:hypothetical protein